MRLTKGDPTGSYSYLADGVSPASPVLTDGHTTFTPGISEYNALGSRFYLGDAQGNSRGLLDGGQAAQDGYNWDAFGSSVSRFGSNPTAYAWNGAAGYQSDGDSGLKLLGHRYYDSRTGRFISQDPAGDGDNWYAYCGNDPMNKTDPRGLSIGLPGTLGAPDQRYGGGGGYIGGDGGGRGLDDFFASEDAATERGQQGYLAATAAASAASHRRYYHLSGEASPTTEAGIEQLMQMAKEGYQFDTDTLEAAYKGIEELAEARGIPIRPTSDNHVGFRIFERFESIKDFRNVWANGKGYAISTYQNQFALFSAKLQMAIIYDGTAKSVYRKFRSFD